MSAGVSRGAAARPIIATCALALIAGCATTPRADGDGFQTPVVMHRAADAVLLEAAQADRLRLLAGDGADSTDCSRQPLQLDGRLALSNGRDGGSGRMRWVQGAGRYSFELAAPVTRQSWRLSGDAGGATLSGLDGGPRSGADPDALLRAATGWDIPVQALRCWLLGLPADSGRYGEADLGFDARRQLVQLEQAGWTIDYAGWQPLPQLNTELPFRVQVRRGDARVRLIVDGWAIPETIPQLGPAAGDAARPAPGAQGASR
jgi:outer membrane lipoprotein LolB